MTVYCDICHLPVHQPDVSSDSHHFFSTVGTDPMTIAGYLLKMISNKADILNDYGINFVYKPTTRAVRGEELYRKLPDAIERQYVNFRMPSWEKKDVVKSIGDYETMFQYIPAGERFRATWVRLNIERVDGGGTRITMKLHDPRKTGS